MIARDYNTFKEINSKFKERDCISKILQFINNDTCLYGKILALYGLRRTGKTTLLEQAALKSKYKPDEISFYELSDKDTISDVEQLIINDSKYGKKLFIFDEITRAKDFINNSSFLPDVFAKQGLKIITAGTDSLGFKFASENELYDRVVFVNTTYISYAEHSKILGTNSIDEYISSGGLMRPSLNETNVKDYISAIKYLDSAVAGNIINSIKNNLDMGEKDSELSSFSKNELTSIIEKLVEIYSGKINEKYIQAKLKTVSLNQITKKFADVFESDKILNLTSNKTNITNSFAEKINADLQIDKKVSFKMVDEFEKYLFDLNFLSINKILNLSKENGLEWICREDIKEYYIVQPAIRYHHIVKGLNFIESSTYYNILSVKQKDEAKKFLENKIKGDMMEQIIVFDVKHSLDDSYIVTKVKFTNKSENGEYDMLIYSKKNNCYWCFEIKHIDIILQSYDENGIYSGQDKHLLNEDYKKEMDRIFGKRKMNCVLYNGKNCMANFGTIYLNAGQFLQVIAECHSMTKTMELMTKDLPTVNKFLISENKKNHNKNIEISKFHTDDNGYGINWN